MFMYILVGLIVLFSVLLLSFVYVEIENIRDENRFNVRILSLFNIKLSLIKIFKMFATTKQNREKILLSEIIENTRKSLELRALTGKFLKELIIIDIDLKAKTSVEDVYYRHLIDAEQWLLLNAFRKIINNRTKTVIKQNYEVINRDDDVPLDYDFDLKVKVRIINIVKVLIFNIKDVRKMIKLFN